MTVLLLLFSDIPSNVGDPQAWKGSILKEVKNKVKGTEKRRFGKLGTLKTIKNCDFFGP